MLKEEEKQSLRARSGGLSDEAGINQYLQQYKALGDFRGKEVAISTILASMCLASFNSILKLDDFLSEKSHAEMGNNEESHSTKNLLENLAKKTSGDINQIAQFTSPAVLVECIENAYKSVLIDKRNAKEVALKDILKKLLKSSPANLGTYLSSCIIFGNPVDINHVHSFGLKQEGNVFKLTLHGADDPCFSFTMSQIDEYRNSFKAFSEGKNIDLSSEASNFNNIDGMHSDLL